jgi:hypothetical protein
MADILRDEAKNNGLTWPERWKALEEWLSQARGRDYVTRTPAVVLQKMRDLMGEE